MIKRKAHLYEQPLQLVLCHAHQAALRRSRCGPQEGVAQQLLRSSHHQHNLHEGGKIHRNITILAGD